MTSYEFEVICKNEIIKELKEKYNEDYKIEDLHLVWYAKELQNMKCTICDSGPDLRYYECTYNGNKKELYVDIYDKIHNTKVTADKFNKVVKR